MGIRSGHNIKIIRGLPELTPELNSKVLHTIDMTNTQFINLIPGDINNKESFEKLKEQNPNLWLEKEYLNNENEVMNFLRFLGNQLAGRAGYKFDLVDNDKKYKFQIKKGIYEKHSNIIYGIINFELSDHENNKIMHSSLVAKTENDLKKDYRIGIYIQDTEVGQKTTYEGLVVFNKLLQWANENTL